MTTESESEAHRADLEREKIGHRPRDTGGLWKPEEAKIQVPLGPSETALPTP